MDDNNRTEADAGPSRDGLEELVRRRTADLTRSNARLLVEIGERRLAEVRLQAAVDSLTRHDEEKSRFVFNVSHDLHTPLTSILCAVDNILKGVVCPVPPELHRYLVMIRNDSQRLIGTVNDILDMSRVDAGTLTLHRTSVPFSPLVRLMLEALRLQAEARAHRLVAAVPPHAGFVSCDRHKIGRCILNILQNAIKYTPAGGTIRVTASVVAGMAQVEVADNGMGIAAEHIDKVMHRFYRVAEQVTGTGLGLALAREIVERHAGSLTIQSPPPDDVRGTLVTLRIPASPPPVVLIATAREAQQQTLRAALEPAGYRSIAATSLAQARRELETARPDVILSALELADADSLALVASIRQQAAWMNLPVVLVLPAGTPAHRRELIAKLQLPTIDEASAPAAVCQAVDAALTTVGTPV